MVTDLVNFLEIKNIYFLSFGGITTILKPIEISSDYILVTTGNQLPEQGFIIINHRDFEIKILVTVIKDFSQINTFTLFYEDPLPDFFQLKVDELTSLNSSIDKRKENRYDIGMNNWEKFGLIKPDISFLWQQNIVKCIISNASVHGALLLGSRSSAKIGEKINLFIPFSDSKVSQAAILINAANVSNSYFNYSVRFLEPISLSWCKHVIDFSNLID